MNSELLRVENLKAYYKTSKGLVKAVDDVSFSVGRKEVYGIAGESGCGKSTLALAILRLLKPPGYIFGGRVFFDGIDLLKLNEEELRNIRWRHISYIPQGAMNSLNPVMRIEDQMIDAILAHENMSREEAKRRCLELLKMVNLPTTCLRMYPHELSGGMKQRVIIAMASALRPKLIIADEPTTALDVVVQRVVLQSLVDLRETLGSSIVMITHDLPILAEVADRIMIMYAGKVVEIGNVFEIFDEPLHPYTKALISAIPSIKEKKIIKGLSGHPPSLLDPPKGCRFYPRCPYATEKCIYIEPKLNDVGGGRLVACHIYGG